MRLKRYLLPTAILAVLALALVVAPDVLAQNYGLDAAAGKSIPKTTDIAAIVGRILKTLLGFVGTLFLLLMVYAGFLYMTARGDAKKVDTAKQLIISAIIGVVIIAGAYAITSFVLTAATGAGSTSGSGSGAETPSTVGTKQKGEACTSGSDCAAPNICDIGGTNTCI